MPLTLALRFLEARMQQLDATNFWVARAALEQIKIDAESRFGAEAVEKLGEANSTLSMLNSIGTTLPGSIPANGSKGLRVLKVVSLRALTPLLLRLLRMAQVSEVDQQGRYTYFVIKWGSSCSAKRRIISTGAAFPIIFIAGENVAGS